MKRFQFSFVVAMLMATVSAPAQRSSDVRGERNVRGGIESSRQHVATNQRGIRSGSRATSQRSVGARTASRGISANGDRRAIQRSGRTVPTTDPNSGSNGRRGYQAAHRQATHRQATHRSAGNGHGARRVPVRAHGYYKTVHEPFLIKAGHWHREHVPAVCGWVYDSCGYRSWGIIEPAHYHRVWIAPCYEQRAHQVWVHY